MATKQQSNHPNQSPKKPGLTPRKTIILACGLVLLGIMATIPTLLKTNTNTTTQANLVTYPNPSYPYYLMQDYQVCGEPQKDNNNNGIPNYLELSADSNGNGVANCNDTKYTDEYMKQMTNIKNK